MLIWYLSPPDDRLDLFRFENPFHGELPSDGVVYEGAEVYISNEGNLAPSCLSMQQSLLALSWSNDTP